MTVSKSLDEGWLTYWLPDDFPEPDVRAHYLARTARRAVERYAPDAPDDIHAEAFVRYASALSTATAHQNRHSIVSGDLRVRWITDDANLFRRCGAAALLSPYKVRRGLAPVETADL